MVLSSISIRKIKLIAYIYIHSLYRLLKNYQDAHIYKQIENLHTVCVETAERRRRRHGVSHSFNLVRAMVFHDVKFDHVTSRDPMLFMEL